MNADEAFKVLDSIVARLELNRQDRSIVESRLNYLHEMAKNTEENESCSKAQNVAENLNKLRQRTSDGGTDKQPDSK